MLVELKMEACFERRDGESASESKDPKPKKNFPISGIGVGVITEWRDIWSEESTDDKFSDEMRLSFDVVFF